MPSISQIRFTFLKSVFEEIVNLDDDIPNFADKSNATSIALAKSIIDQLGFVPNIRRVKGQTSGKKFQDFVKDYLIESFGCLQHLRPGQWKYEIGTPVSDFEQYEHLADLAGVLKEYPMLRATLGDYIITPDITVSRLPVADDEINFREEILGKDHVAERTPLREHNSKKPILHASISCKWTIRSDRSQNARTEGLNLIRNRKGNAPHIVVVTAEPTPQRLSSIAIGTGDIDCVYHISLQELIVAVEKQKNDVLSDNLDMLIRGKRLRDISDLPFDIAI